MSHNSLISVIVPCYNQDSYLREALDSVLNQTHKNWECIIVNDGSSDNTKALSLEYCKLDTRFLYLEQENLGVAAARNLGISSSKGAFIQLLDADDVLESNKFSLQADFLIANDIVDIVYGSTRYFLHGDFQRKFILNQNGMAPSIDVHFNDKDQTAALVFRNITTICAPLYRAEVFDAAVFKDILYEDWFFHIECSLRGKVFHFERIDGTSCYVRMTAQSQMGKHTEINTRSPEIFINALDALLKQYSYQRPFFPNQPVLTDEKPKDGFRSFLRPIVGPVYRALKKWAR